MIKFDEDNNTKANQNKFKCVGCDLDFGSEKMTATVVFKEIKTNELFFIKLGCTLLNKNRVYSRADIKQMKKIFSNHSLKMVDIMKENDIRLIEI